MSKQALNIETNFDLSTYNTMGISSVATEAVIVKSENELLQSLDSKFPIYPLGGGSNVLLPDRINRRVLINRIEGIEVLHEDDDIVDIQIGGGHNWHELVTWAVSNGYGGIENLALIPGTVGAAPIQNIGAYGVELKDVFQGLNCVDLSAGHEETFTNEECQFGYRDSIFKGELKGKKYITRVRLRLLKSGHQPNIEYGAIRSDLEEHGQEEATVKNTCEAVIRIRQRKLPDPSVIGNTGSFFKNAVVSQDIFEELKKHHPDIVFYPIDDEKVKIPTGWLIDKCGWKGYSDGPAGVYEKQALVLVNRGGATATQMRELADRIAGSVFHEFGIQIVPEVNIVSEI